MPSQKIIMRSFHHHCNYNSPFFCNYSHKGLETHCHVDFYEFCIIVSGTYEHTYKKQKSTCEMGTLLFLSPGESHSLVATSQDSYHYAFIIRQDFFVDFCNKYQHNAQSILETPAVTQQTAGVLFAYISQLASNLTYTSNQKLLPLAKLLLHNILFTCFDTMPVTSANINKIYAVDLSQLFNSYKGLDEDISVLCSKYPVSRTALINDFKTLTGYTVVQYRNIKRMEYAAYLLTEANHSISDICNMLNIENPSHFAKQFKKQYGLTPKQYQIQQRSIKK